MQKMQPPFIFCFRSHACRIICPCIPCFAKRHFSLCYSQCNKKDGSQQHNFLCPTTWMQVQLVDTLTRILKVLIQLGIWLIWPVLPLFMCSEKDSAHLFPLNQSFAAFAQIHTRFSPPKLIFLCVLLQRNSRCEGIWFLNCLLVPCVASCVTRCVLWTGATETCPFISTWKKQQWNETNGDLAFM